MKYTSPHAVTAKRLHRGVSDYHELGKTHGHTADEMAEQYTQRTETGVLTQWPNYQTLRQHGHELELAQHCFDAAQDCMKYAHKAQWKAAHHAALCAIKDSAAGLIETAQSLVLSLAEVAQQHREHSHRKHSPPGRSFTRSVLSTCHASNAPGAVGLSLITLENSNSP
jgi:hypothetical protein